MKRYLTTILIITSIIVIIVGLSSEVRFAGAVSWGLAFILLLFALYFTKYISNKKTKKKE